MGICFVLAGQACAWQKGRGVAFVYIPLISAGLFFLAGLVFLFNGSTWAACADFIGVLLLVGLFFCRWWKNRRGR